MANDVRMSVLDRIRCGYILSILQNFRDGSEFAKFEIMEATAAISAKYNCESSNQSLSSLDGTRLVAFEKPRRFIFSDMSSDDKGEVLATKSTAEPKIADGERLMADFLKEFALESISEGPASQNVAYAAAQFDLDALEQKMLLLGLRSYTSNEFHIDGSYGNQLPRLFSDLAPEKSNLDTSVIAAALGASCQDVAVRLQEDGRLRRCGALLPGQGTQLFGNEGRWRMPRLLFTAMVGNFATQAQWAETLMGRKVEGALSWFDYEHISDQRDLALRLLDALTQRPDKGIGILLVGSVGTGKTEFAGTLAARAGRSLWSVGESKNGSEPNRTDRIGAMKMSGAILERSAGANIILVDEAEDILTAPPVTGEKRPDFSKAFLNRYLETCPVPVIWTTNTLEGVDAATVRRMSLVIELETPDAPVRERIWMRVAERRGLALSPEDACHLSKNWSASPAVSDRAAHVTSLVKGGRAELETVMDGLENALGTRPPEMRRNLDAFDFDLVNSDIPLEGILARLSKPGVGRGWSICMHGASGTGKSMFARRLAERLDIPVIFKRASDLLSPYQGETEKNIARAFTRARRKRAMLLIDEVDSLLAFRDLQSSPSSVSRTNEMLTWMECLETPFVCTTNHLEAIDRAAMRRLTFKIELKPMSSRQSIKAFRTILGCEAPGVPPDGLTPGDFAIVASKAVLMDEFDPDTLMHWLVGESKAKSPFQEARMGFNAHAAHGNVDQHAWLNRDRARVAAIGADKKPE